jgi:hypothetical protein
MKGASGIINKGIWEESKLSCPTFCGQPSFLYCNGEVHLKMYKTSYLKEGKRKYDYLIIYIL